MGRRKVETNPCLVEDCSQPNKSLGYCSAHYQALRRSTDTNLSGKTCSTTGCDRPHSAQGYCRKCYARLRKLPEDKRPFKVRNRERGTCNIPSCGRPHAASGYCDIHYRRWKKYGDPRESTPVDTRAWNPDQPCYIAVHNWVRDERGPATDHACQHCTSPAAEWAYDHTDDQELTDQRGLTYSTKAEHYIPLCRRCHRRADTRRVRCGEKFRVQAEMTDPQTTRDHISKHRQSGRSLGVLAKLSNIHQRMISEIYSDMTIRLIPVEVATAILAVPVRRTHAECIHYLTTLVDSGLSVTEIAAVAGVPPCTLYHARSRNRFSNKVALQMEHAYIQLTTTPGR